MASLFSKSTADAIRTARAGWARSRAVWSWCVGFLLLVAVAGGLATAQAPAPDPGAADTAAQSAAERLRALQSESDALAKQERTLLVDLRKLEVERALKSEELA